MIAAGYGTVSDFEIFFLVVSSVGVVFASLNVFSLWGDYRFLYSQGRNNNKDGAWLLTKAGLFSEMGRLFVQATFVYIAILIMTIPDPPPAGGWRNQTTSGIARWAFLISALWICSKTAYTWYIRKRLIELNGNGSVELHRLPAEEVR